MKCIRRQTVKELIEERNRALFSFDKEAIIAWMKKCGEPIPSNERVFMGAVCKAICNITNAPKDAVDKAKLWLSENHMSPAIHWDYEGIG